MTKKVAHINKQRQKNKPRSLEEAAKAAVRRYLDPEFLASLNEPQGLASGKTTESGGFVHNDNEIDNKDSLNEKNNAIKITELEKQKIPLKNEVSLENLFSKMAVYGIKSSQKYNLKTFNPHLDNVKKNRPS